MRRGVGVWAAVLLAGSCAPRPPATTGGPSDTVTEVPHLEERALLLLLADRKEYEPFTVDRVRKLGPAMRRELALALGRADDPRGRPVLEELAADPEAQVRRAAVFALGLLGDEAATAALLRAVRDGDRETGLRAVEALARLGAELPPVVDALRPLAPGELWARLLPVLFRFPARDSFELAMEAGGSVDDLDLFRWSIYALARDPLPAAAPVLREVLADPDPELRGWAARALGTVGDGNDLERLHPLLADASSGPVIQALRAARKLLGEGKAAPPDDWRGDLDRLMEDARSGVRSTAIECAGAWLLDEKLGRRLSDLARQGRGRERELALLALARAGVPGAADLTTAAARSAAVSLRRAAAVAAGELRSSAVLESLAEDDVPAVREAALEELLESSSERWLEPGLQDPDAGVRAAVLEWLTDHPVRSAADLLAAVSTGGGGELPDVVEAGIDALVARAEAVEEERREVAQALLVLSEAPQFLVRRWAATALGRLGLPVPPVGAAEVRESLESYRLVVETSLAPHVVRLETARGPVDIALDCEAAPRTCLNFLQLANLGFYDGLPFHRVVPDFVVQAGDPRGDGRGGPGYTLRDEQNLLRTRRGSVGMALGGPDTAGSQFFIALSPQPHLDGEYTLFGRVRDGWDALDALQQGDVIERARELPAEAAP